MPVRELLEMHSEVHRKRTEEAEAIEAARKKAK